MIVDGKPKKPVFKTLEINLIAVMYSQCLFHYPHIRTSDLIVQYQPFTLDYITSNKIGLRGI